MRMKCFVCVHMFERYEKLVRWCFTQMRAAALIRHDQEEAARALRDAAPDINDAYAVDPDVSAWEGNWAAAPNSPATAALLKPADVVAIGRSTRELIVTRQPALPVDTPPAKAVTPDAGNLSLKTS